LEELEMDVSDGKALEAVLRNWEKQIARKQSAPAESVGGMQYTPYRKPEQKARARRCNCGACPRCEEAARWERIFQAKFEDPEYYKRRRVPHISPLSRD
jgi:hypothetical protein